MYCMSVVEVQRNHRKIQQKLPVDLFTQKCLQEEYCRFLAVSAVIFHEKKECVYLPPLLRKGWEKHIQRYLHNYYEVIEQIGLPEEKQKFTLVGVSCMLFQELYAQSFGYPLNSSVYHEDASYCEKVA